MLTVVVMGILAKCFGYTKREYFFLFRKVKKGFFSSWLLFFHLFPACPLTFVPQNPLRCHLFLQSLLMSLSLFFIGRNHSILYATFGLCFSPPSIELFLFALSFILSFGENVTLHWIVKSILWTCWELRV